MKCYMAPLEGITGYIYRSTHHKYFGGVDRYFTPFLVPTHTESLKSREVKDILPEHNKGMDVVPQILTNHADHFMWAARKIQELGYQEVNLNLGCPSPTVVPKHRGSGLLAYPEEMEALLAEIIRGLDACGMKLSVKTRIGKDSPEEFKRLLEIFNRYPIQELIIHPRVQRDLYRNHANREVFCQACEDSVNPVCYNGDLFNRQDVERFLKEYEGADSSVSVMLGRGIIANPALAENMTREDKNTDALDKRRLRDFHDELAARYVERVSGDRNVLFKMKELWYYMGGCFQNPEKYLKKIRKSQRLSDYQRAVSELFEEQELSELPGFKGMQK